MHPDALSLAIGDGGNAVGMGRAVLADEIAELSPGGEFAPLLVNGCYRNRVQLGWDRVRGRSVRALPARGARLPPAAAAAGAAGDGAAGAGGGGAGGAGGGGGARSHHVTIMAQPYGAVDGKYSEMTHAVDGLAWEPCPREAV